MTNSKAPPLFVSNFVTWYSECLQHGMVVCPEYFYGLKNPHTAPMWSKVAEWRACGEHEREVFWVLPNGHIGYAGMYMCHTGPDKLRLNELKDIQSDVSALLILCIQRLRPVADDGVVFRPCFPTSYTTPTIAELRTRITPGKPSVICTRKEG